MTRGRQPSARNSFEGGAETRLSAPAIAAAANTRAFEFLTGYLIEKSLAVDNIFVFLMIFTYFSVPPAYQKRVLMYGIVGAIVLRTVMILVGGWLIAQLAAPVDTTAFAELPSSADYLAREADYLRDRRGKSARIVEKTNYREKSES